MAKDELESEVTQGQGLKTSLIVMVFYSQFKMQYNLPLAIDFPFLFSHEIVFNLKYAEFIVVYAGEQVSNKG